MAALKRIAGRHLLTFYSLLTKLLFSIDANTLSLPQTQP